MSDVEQLTHNNQERRRWADEVEMEYRNLSNANRESSATASAKHRNDKREVLWAANTACAMFCGMCGTMLAIGLVETHLPTVIISALCGGVFLAAGAMIERQLRWWAK